MTNDILRIKSFFNHHNYSEDGFEGGCDECERYCVDCDGTNCIPLTLIDEEREAQEKAIDEIIKSGELPFKF